MNRLMCIKNNSTQQSVYVILASLRAPHARDRYTNYLYL